MQPERVLVHAAPSTTWRHPWCVAGECPYHGAPENTGVPFGGDACVGDNCVAVVTPSQAELDGMLGRVGRVL